MFNPKISNLHRKTNHRRSTAAIITAVVLMATSCANGRQHTNPTTTTHITKPIETRNKYQEFTTWFWNMFDSYDENGQLNKQYMKTHGYNSTFDLGKTTPEELAEEFIDNYDNNGDGNVSCDEFTKGAKRSLVKRNPENKAFIEGYRKFLESIHAGLDINESPEKVARGNNTIDKKEMSANFRAVTENGQMDAEKVFGNIIRMGKTGNPETETANARYKHYIHTL